MGRPKPPRSLSEGEFARLERIAGRDRHDRLVRAAYVRRGDPGGFIDVHAIRPRSHRQVRFFTLSGPASSVPNCHGWTLCANGS